MIYNKEMFKVRGGDGHLYCVTQYKLFGVLIWRNYEKIE